MKEIINDFFSQEECEKYIKYGEDIGFVTAGVRLKEGEVMMQDYRNNGRVILEDQKLADELFERLKPHLPNIVDGWVLKGLNEQFKIYRYEPGQSFKMHRDAPYVKSEKEKSFLTMMIYLNEGYEGGETFFMGSENVKGVTGQCLVFRQNMLHAGAEVKSGVKYAIRTDVMYEKQDVYRVEIE